MNYRGDEDPQAAYELPQSASVKAASARLASMRGRYKQPAAKNATAREAAYREQRQGGALTPAQQRRARKKNNRTARA